MKNLAALIFVSCLAASAFAEDHHALTKDDRVNKTLTVYNNNFAVVSDQRRVRMTKDATTLEIIDVVRSLQPETVSLRSDKAKGFVAEVQNFRYDLLDKQSLLERFVGRKVKYSRSLMEDGNYEKVLREGILLSINPEIVMFGDVIEIEPEGTISLPFLPDDLTTLPTLIFHGENRHNGAQDVTLRYLANDLSWKADYTLTLDKSDKGTLEGWVSVENHSGSDLTVDQLNLVAGDVNREQVQVMPKHRVVMMDMAESVAAVPSAESVGDYHRYGFDGPLELAKNDLTQLRLISTGGVRGNRYYRLTSHVQRYLVEGTEKVSPAVVLGFTNNRKNNLGKPLPAGVVRVFTSNKDAETFIGEARIGHTADGQEVELEIGRAFDISVKRLQKGVRPIDKRRHEVSYTITVLNSGDEKVEVELQEKLLGIIDWQVIDASADYERRDSSTLVFVQSVAPKSEATLEYRVRLGW